MAFLAKAQKEREYYFAINKRLSIKQQQQQQQQKPPKKEPTYLSGS